jgi:hypothetical protein
MLIFVMLVVKYRYDASLLPLIHPDSEGAASHDSDFFDTYGPDIVIKL